jgi:hypothetical protein
MAMLYPFVERQIIRFKFVFSLHTRCVRCTNVDIRNKRDYVDPLTKSPLGLIQRLLHAPIKHCNRCRLQYYDWRPVRPAPPQKTAANPR